MVRGAAGEYAWGVWYSDGVGDVTTEELDAGGERAAEVDCDGIEDILGFALRFGDGGPMEGLRDGGFCGGM